MSTLKTTNLQHASAGSPAIVLDAAGDATYAGTHDFSAATVTGITTGKILQTIFATNSGPTSTTSSTYSDTNTTATITPSSATSKVLVTVHQNGVAKLFGGAISECVSIRLMRDATVLSLPGISVAYTQNTDTNYVGSVSTSYLDAPATTSAIVYKTQFMSGDNSGYVGVQESSAASTIILQEIAQ